MLGVLAQQRRGDGHGGRDRQLAPGAQRGRAQPREGRQVVQRGPDGPVGSAPDAPRQRPRPRDRPQRDADEQRTGEDRCRRTVAGQRRARREQRQPRGEQRARVAPRQQQHVGRSRHRAARGQCLQQRERGRDGGDLRGDEEDDRPGGGRDGARRGAVEDGERRATRRQHGGDRGDGGAGAPARGDLGVEGRGDLRRRPERPDGVGVAARGRRVGEVVGALAQEAPAGPAAHAQRGVELGEIPPARAHVAAPRTRSIAAEKARHSRRDAVAARRPAGVIE